jgi:hypothetical protein
MAITVYLDNRILEAKMDSFYRSLSRARDNKNLTNEFAFAVEGLVDAVDDMLDEIKPMPKKPAVDRLNARNRFLQAQSFIFMDLAQAPAAPAYLRFRQACSARYHDRPSKTHMERYESNRASIKAIGDFIEAGALFFMADNNRLMKTYNTGQSFKTAQIDQLIAVMRGHIAGVEGNVVPLSVWQPRP